MHSVQEEEAHPPPPWVQPPLSPPASVPSPLFKSAVYLHFSTSSFHLLIHTTTASSFLLLLLLLFHLSLPSSPASFGFSSQTDQRQRESSPRHIRSMAMIGASESQERKLHGCAHRQQISYFQKPLIAASHLDFWSSDKFHWCRLKRRGWLATWWHLSLSPVLSSALCEQYPLNKPFTPLLSWLLWSVKRSQQAVELPR